MESPATVWAFAAIGTQWRVSLYEDIAIATVGRARQAIAARIETFDRTYSRFRPDSLVTKASSAAGSYDFPADSVRLFGFYKQLYDVSGGAVTPLIGQALSDAGYDADYRLRPGELSPPPAWEAAVSFKAGRLTTRQPVLLDFGAAGKGYLVDIVAQTLQAQGISRFCVDGGGDMVIHGLKGGLPVGLEQPDDPERVIGIVDIADGAICGSAGNRRAWPGYTHILDPRTLASPRHIAATWCMAADALTADGIATALYFVAPARLRQAYAFDYCIAFADGTVEYSDGFKAGMFVEADMASA